MLTISQTYVKEHNITFSTNTNPAKSKPKGIIFTKGNYPISPEALVLNGYPLLWAKQANYLGNLLSNVPDGWKDDTRVKRAKYIERNVELQQEFPSAHPSFLCKINRIYNSSFPGSVLFDLSSKSTQQLINSWSISLRHMWGLPATAHSYLIGRVKWNTC